MDVLGDPIVNTSGENVIIQNHLRGTVARNIIIAGTSVGDVELRVGEKVSRDPGYWGYGGVSGVEVMADIYDEETGEYLGTARNFVQMDHRGYRGDYFPHAPPTWFIRNQDVIWVESVRGEEERYYDEYYYYDENGWRMRGR